jgi:hypothetical protein
MTPPPAVRPPPQRWYPPGVIPPPAGTTYRNRDETEERGGFRPSRTRSEIDGRGIARDPTPVRRAIPVTPHERSRVEIAPGVEEEIQDDGHHRRHVIIFHHLRDGED